MARRASVEVLGHQKENTSPQWAHAFDLRASCRVTVGRQLFAGSPHSQTISRKQLELSFDGREVVARTVGTRCSFTLDHEGRGVPLPTSAVIQVTEGMIFSFDKTHNHCLRVRTRLPQCSNAHRPCSTDGSCDRRRAAIQFVDLDPAPPPLGAMSTSDARSEPPVESEPPLAAAADDDDDVSSSEASGTPLDKPAPPRATSATPTVSASDARGMLPGESEARRRGARRRWVMRPSRSIDDDDGPHEAHLRTVESAFCRAGGRAERIASVEYHLNPEQEARWHAKRAEYDRQYGRGGHTILYAFHGTPEKNVESILRGGFDLSYVGSTTDQGLFGAAIYLSELASHAALYNAGSGRLLVCKVLVGRPFVSYLVEGCSLEPGFTCHVSGPDGAHLAIFDVAAALPLYVLNLRDEAALSSRPLADLQLAQPLVGMAGIGVFPPLVHRAARKRRAGDP